MTHRKSDKRMTKEREQEIRDTHGCLIPREGVSMPSCHEYTSCDCTVFELLAELDALKAERGEMAKLMWLRFTREGAPSWNDS